MGKHVMIFMFEFTLFSNEAVTRYLFKQITKHVLINKQA